MLKNYLKVAFRTLLKNRLQSGINIFGLALGLASCLLIFLFVQEELSYDRFHVKSDRIYRVVKDFVDSDGGRLPDATTPPALAPAIAREIPGVEKVCRVFPNWGGKLLLQSDQQAFYEENYCLVDTSFFQIFDLEILAGNPESAMREVNQVVITDQMARKYFGAEEALGKEFRAERNVFTVGAVVKPLPVNSHFHFDVFLSLNRLSDQKDQFWGWYNFYTYILLSENSEIAAVDAQIQELFKRNEPESENQFYSQALSDIHLHSNLKWELEANGDIKYIYLFILIALFVLVIASVNYINLATARSGNRAKEVGVRKVSGAHRTSLIAQFLTESLLTVLIAGLLAIILAEAALPAFNHLLGRELSFLFGQNASLLLLLVGGLLILGLLSGLYPAFYLARFRPAWVLKGIKAKNGGQSWLRKGLVVAQFTIAVALIAGMLVIQGQLNYIQSKNLGFAKEQVIVIDNSGAADNPETLKNRFSAIQGVVGAGGSSATLGGLNWTQTMSRRGVPEEEGVLVNYAYVDHDYLDVLKMQMLEGRNYSREFSTDTLDALIINETAAKSIGLEAPYIGKEVRWETGNDTVNLYRKVVGVVKDFHFTSLHESIKPYAFELAPRQADNINLRIASKDYRQIINNLKMEWENLAPDRPFEFVFLDERLDKLYRADQNFQSVFSYFTFLAILIACLGLFALASFTAERRIKEIGIRKVLGAGIGQLVFLLSNDFLRLVVAAVILATPIAWLAMNRWLDNFAYRIEISWTAFALAGLTALLIAFLTVSFEAFKAARRNPVHALKYE